MMNTKSYSQCVNFPLTNRTKTRSYYIIILRDIENTPTSIPKDQCAYNDTDTGQDYYLISRVIPESVSYTTVKTVQFVLQVTCLQFIQEINPSKQLVNALKSKQNLISYLSVKFSNIDTYQRSNYGSTSALITNSRLKNFAKNNRNQGAFVTFNIRQKQNSGKANSQLELQDVHKPHHEHILLHKGHHKVVPQAVGVKDHIQS